MAGPYVIVSRRSVILSLSKDGHGSQAPRYAMIVAGAGIIFAGPSFDRLRMTLRQAQDDTPAARDDMVEAQLIRIPCAS